MQSFKMAIKSISGNKMRAILTMLGIIIGVMALVILVSLVNGATSSVTKTVSSLGNDLLTVTISDDKNQPVSLSDLAEWSKEDKIGSVAPTAEESITAKYEANTESLTVYGTTPSYQEVEGLTLLLGRFLKTTDVENNNTICVINEAAATELVGYTDCLGTELSFNGMKYTVVGVLKDEDAFSVKSSDAMESAMSSITSMLTILLGGIAAISLIVGGIGIMNIMLVTVTERTREIGIRKAIGASRGDILKQFLIEAVVLCMMGCGIGIFLSWCVLRAAAIIVSGLSLTFEMNGTVVLVAVVFCFMIGVVFGLYPANKAAKMKPIDALHYGG